MAFFRKTFPRAVAAAALILAVTLPAADAPFAPEVQQRLDLLKTGYETFVLNTTTIPYEAGVKALNERVKPTLERESAAAAQRTDLDTLVRIKADLERLGEGQVLTAVEEAPPAALKHAYSAYKLELDRLTSIQKANLADAKRRYDKGLELVQKELTQEQDVTAALLVKELREALVDAAAPTVAEATDQEPGSGENLLANGSFQKGTSKWELTMHDHSDEAKMGVDKKVLFHDKPTLRVTNPALNDTRAVQKVKVKPRTRYRMAGFIKTQDIKDAKGNEAAKPGAKVNGGGCLCLTGKYGYKTNFVTADDWTEVSQEFKTQEEAELVFECRLGYFGATVTGTAWFAELSLTEVKDSAPQAATAQANLPQWATSIPVEWTYHQKLNAGNTAEIFLLPNGIMEFHEQSGVIKKGSWKRAKTGVVVYFLNEEWKLNLSGDVASFERPQVGTRYMKVKAAAK